MKSISLITLIVVFFLVTYYDLKLRKIPNFIALPLLFWGIFLNTYMNGWEALKISIYGFVISTGFFLFLYIIGAMGAGDVKLMSGIGALLGAKKIILSIILTVCIGGVMGFMMLLIKIYLKYKNDKHEYKNEAQWIDKSELKINTVPYGIAIVLGAIITMYLQ